jgi:signal transduction histidine kinase
MRLARRASLNPPLEGTDELGLLDATFHKMADEREQIERMKQEFVAMLSHDLRSPLTSVQGTLTLAATGAYGDLSERLSSELNRAQRNAQRLIGLVNDLLDIEKMDSGMMELHKADVSLKEIFERSLESVEALAEPEKIVIKARHANLDVCADRDLLIRVLVNLLSNAIKYSPAGGVIEITASDFPHGGTEVRVCDQGPGIPDSYKSSIFDRFQQVQGTKGGSGLGLAICKAIVEGHGGTIGVESEQGKGSTFWFRIPA